MGFGFSKCCMSLEFYKLGIRLRNCQSHSGLVKGYLVLFPGNNPLLPLTEIDFPYPESKYSETSPL